MNRCIVNPPKLVCLEGTNTWIPEQPPKPVPVDSIVSVFYPATTLSRQLNVPRLTELMQSELGYFTADGAVENKQGNWEARIWSECALQVLEPH